MHEVDSCHPHQIMPIIAIILLPAMRSYLICPPNTPAPGYTRILRQYSNLTTHKRWHSTAKAAVGVAGLDGDQMRAPCGHRPGGPRRRILRESVT